MLVYGMKSAPVAWGVFGFLQEVNVGGVWYYCIKRKEDLFSFLRNV